MRTGLQNRLRLRSGRLAGWLWCHVMIIMLLLLLANIACELWVFNIACVLRCGMLRPVRLLVLMSGALLGRRCRCRWFRWLRGRREGRARKLAVRRHKGCLGVRQGWGVGCRRRWPVK